MANRLRKLRKRAGLTQVELARKSGLSRVSIQRYETGKTIPSVDRIATIAETLNTTVDSIVGKRPAGDKEEIG